MAYVERPKDDDKDKTNIYLGDGGGGLGGDASAGTSTGGATEAPPTNAGNGFVGIGDYLKTNAGGAEKLGTQVSSGINQAVDAAGNAINTGKELFNTSVDAGKTAYNQGVVDNTIQTGTATDDFNKLISGSYAGPKNWSEAGVQSGVDSALDTAQEKAQLAGTAGGRVELLRGIAEGRPQTLGNLNLNSALVNGNAGAAQSIRDAAARVNPLTSTLTAAQQEAAARVNAAQANNTAVKNQALTNVGGYLDTQTAQQQAQLKTMQEAAAAKEAQAQQYLAALAAVKSPTGNLVQTPSTGTTAGTANRAVNASVNVNTNPVPNPGAGGPGSPAGWEALGLTQEQATALANAVAGANDLGAPVNVAQYYNAGSPLTQANTISQQEAARLNALAAIVGKSGYSSAAATPGSFNYTQAFGATEQARNAAKAAADAKAAQDAKDAAALAAAQALANQTGQQQQVETAPGIFQKIDPIGSAIIGSLPGGGAVSGLVNKVASKDPVMKLLSKCCVVTTAMVDAGEMKPREQQAILLWCEKKLRTSRIGEALRRGYQVIASTYWVPVIRSHGVLDTYYKQTFVNAIDLMKKKKVPFWSIPNSIFWITVMTALGACVTKEYAESKWTALYNEGDE